MKKIPKPLRVALACVAIFCAADFISHIHISRGGFSFKIGAAVTVLGAFCFFGSVATYHDELSRYKQEGKDNFKLLFSRKLPTDSLFSDDVLARLSLDYGLSDSEIERIARDGVHEAAAQYRKSHPLDQDPE